MQRSLIYLYLFAERGQVPFAAGIGVAVVPPVAVHDQHDGQRGRDQTEALSRPSPIKGSDFVKKKLSQFSSTPVNFIQGFYHSRIEDLQN